MIFIPVLGRTEVTHPLCTLRGPKGTVHFLKKEPTGPHGNSGGLSQGQNPHDISLAKAPALSQKEVSLS